MLYLKTIDPRKEKVDTLIIPVCEDKNIHYQDVFTSLVKQAKKFKEFTGKKGDEITLYTLSGIKADRVIFIGIGTAAKVDAETLRSFAGKGIKKSIRELKLMKIRHISYLM